MFNVGGGEILVIMVLALIVLGPDKLPEAAKQAGKYLSEFRRMSHGFQQEIRSAMDLNPLNDKSSGSASGSSSASSAPSLPPLPVTEAPGANLSSAADNVPPAMRTPPPEPRGDISVDGPSGSFS